MKFLGNSQLRNRPRNISRTSMAPSYRLSLLRVILFTSSIADDKTVNDRRRKKVQTSGITQASCEGGELVDKQWHRNEVALSASKRPNLCRSRASTEFQPIADRRRGCRALSTRVSLLTSISSIFHDDTRVLGEAELPANDKNSAFSSASVPRCLPVLVII